MDSWKLYSIIVLLLASMSSRALATQDDSTAVNYTDETVTTAVDMSSLPATSTINPTPSATSSIRPTPPPSQPTTTGDHTHTPAPPTQPTTTGHHTQRTSTSQPTTTQTPTVFFWVIGFASILAFVLVVTVAGAVCICCVVRKRRKCSRPKVNSKLGKSVVVNTSTSSVPLVVSRTSTPPVEHSPTLDRAEAERTSHLYSTLRWNRQPSTVHNQSPGNSTEPGVVTVSTAQSPSDNGHSYTEPGLCMVGSTPTYCYPRFMGDGDSITAILEEDTASGSVRYSDWSTQELPQYELPDPRPPRSHEIPQQDGVSIAKHTKTEGTPVGTYTPPNIRGREMLQVSSPQNVYQGLSAETIDYVSLYST